MLLTSKWGGMGYGKEWERTVSEQKAKVINILIYFQWACGIKSKIVKIQ